MNCQIDFSLDGVPGRVIVDAPRSFDALLAWLATVPESAQVKAIVKVSIATDDPLGLLLSAPNL